MNTKYGWLFIIIVMVAAGVAFMGLIVNILSNDNTILATALGTLLIILLIANLYFALEVDYDNS